MSPPARNGIPDDLAELLDALRSAAADPQSQVLLPLIRRVRSLAHRLLPPDSPLRRGMDSEDLMQETILDLVQAVPAFRGTTWNEFLAFTRALMERRQVHLARRLRVRRSELQPEIRLGDQEVLHTGQGSPSSDACMREDVRHLRELLDNLPSGYREAMELKLRGLSSQEIATRLQVGEEAARQRVSRALRMLRERWEKG